MSLEATILTQTQWPSLVLESWRHASDHDGATWVMPDGCRDLIVQTDPDGHSSWIVTSLDVTTRCVAAQAGMTWLGWRLEPGVMIEHTELLQAIRHVDCVALVAGDPHAMASVAHSLHDHTKRHTRLQEILYALAIQTSVQRAARHLGVTQRTLQRVTIANTGYPPVFWLRLARIRSALRALGTELPLASVAADYGYSDQSHLTRECRHWTGLTPSQVGKRPEILAMVNAPGYG